MSHLLHGAGGTFAEFTARLDAIVLNRIDEGEDEDVSMTDGVDKRQQRT